MPEPIQVNKRLVQINQKIWRHLENYLQMWIRKTREIVDIIPTLSCNLVSFVRWYPMWHGIGMPIGFGHLYQHTCQNDEFLVIGCS